MIRFKHIAVVGVGLIGGSFALAARRAGLCERLTGWDGGRPLDGAISSGVIDAVESSFDEGRMCEADLVYLAAPIEGILDFIRHRGHLVRPGAIITDAGSAKREICKSARESLREDVHFVGGHPMAGSHNRGVEFASADLFLGAPYVLAVSEGQEASDRQSDIVRKIIEIVFGIGARPVMMTADRHDAVVARISHAPQIVSTALALAVAHHVGEDATKIAGSGLVDMTRLAHSRWEVWEGICRTNGDELAGAIEEILIAVGSLRDAIAKKQWGEVRSAFQKANEFAENLYLQGADKS